MGKCTDCRHTRGTYPYFPWFLTSNAPSNELPIGGVQLTQSAQAELEQHLQDKRLFWTHLQDQPRQL